MKSEDSISLPSIPFSFSASTRLLRVFASHHLHTKMQHPLISLVAMLSTSSLLVMAGPIPAETASTSLATLQTPTSPFTEAINTIFNVPRSADAETEIEKAADGLFEFGKERRRDAIDGENLMKRSIWSDFKKWFHHNFEGWWRGYRLWFIIPMNNGKEDDDAGMFSVVDLAYRL